MKTATVATGCARTHHAEAGLGVADPEVAEGEEADQVAGVPEGAPGRSVG